MRTLLYLLALIAPLFGAEASPRVAVVFNGGDAKNPHIGDTFNERALEAKAFYEKLGYHVVSLPKPGQPTESAVNEFRKTIEGLKDAKELQLAFFGHGEIAKPGMNWDQERFPHVTVPGGEFAARYMLPHQAPQWRLNAGEDGLGVNDLRATLIEARKKNPTLRTTIHALNCFSGFLPYTLADLPGVQAFSSTHAGSIAVSISSNPAKDSLPAPGSITDFPKLFQAALSKGATYHEAHLSAQREYQKLVSQSSDNFPFTGATLSLPISPLQGLLRSWCETRKGGGPKHEVCVDVEPIPKGVKDILEPAKELALETMLAPSREAKDFFTGLRKRFCEPTDAFGKKAATDIKETRALLLEAFGLFAEDAKGALFFTKAPKLKEKLKFVDGLVARCRKQAESEPPGEQTCEKEEKELAKFFPPPPAAPVGLGPAAKAARENEERENQRAHAACLPAPASLAKLKDPFAPRAKMRTCFLQKLRERKLNLAAVRPYLIPVSSQCQLLSHALALVNEDLTCAKHLENEAPAATWERIMDLLQEGNKKP